MPHNLIKSYNQLLEIAAYNPSQRNASLKGVFNKDIANNNRFTFLGRRVNPTVIDGQDTMETLFRHLTTEITDKKTRRREFEIDRSLRLHWVKFHIDCRKTQDVIKFLVEEPEGLRVYIYDKSEKYVVVLEPLREIDEYYLLTAYYVKGKDAKRDKIGSKYKRRIVEYT